MLQLVRGATSFPSYPPRLPPNRTPHTTRTTLGTQQQRLDGFGPVSPDRLCNRHGRKASPSSSISISTVRRCSVRTQEDESNGDGLFRSLQHAADAEGSRDPRYT